MIKKNSDTSQILGFKRARKAVGRAIRSVFESLEERRLLSTPQVWVDDNWAFAPSGDVGAPGLGAGDTVQEPTGPTHTFGIDAYSTIQEGVNFVDNGGIVVVLDGLYTERVAIGKSVSVSGQSDAGVMVQAEGGGPVDGHDAFDINAPGAAVGIDHVVIRNSDWGIRSLAGNVSVSHCTISLNGFDGAPYPAGLTAADAAAHFTAHATDGGAIWIVDSTATDISFNNVSSGDRGIVLTHASGAHVHDNSVSSNARGGIGLFDGSNNFVDNNDISNNGGEGLLLSGESATSATGNHANNNANAGIVIFNPREISVSNSQVNTNNSRSFSGDGSTNQWPAAIYATGAGAAGGVFTLHLDGNSLSNNGSGGNAEGSVGVYLGASLRGDETSFSSHTISGHTIGLRSSVSNVSITNSSVLRSTTGILLDGGAGVAMDNVTFDGGSDAASNVTDLKITSAAGSISALTNSKFRGKNTGGKYIVSLRAETVDATTDKFFLAGPPAVSLLGSAMSLTQLFTAEDRIDHGLDAGFGGLIHIKAASAYVTNSSGSIQRGIDAASPSDTINVKAGTFTESLSIDKSVVIIGQGDTTILRAAAAIPNRFTTSVDNHPIVFVSGGAKPTIRSMKIDGLGNGNANSRFEGIAFYNAGGTVDHVTLTGIRNNPLDGVQSGMAIYANNSDGVSRGLTISNNTISDYQSNGMALSGVGLGVDVFGNTLSGAGAASVIAQRGIEINSGASGSVHGNTISGNSRGIFSSGSAGVLIEGNDVSGSNESGISASGGSATINANSIHDNSGNGVGIGPGVFTVTHNFITGNQHDGIFIDATADGASSLVIRHNSISGNTVAGLDNESTGRVNAGENWWGTINGPANPANGFNVGAQGNAAVGNLAFAPWLASGIDTDPAVGFQPDGSVFGRVSNDAGGVFGTIQEAIDGTSAGGVITLADGMYNESNIHVNKALTIQGASRDGVIVGPSMVDGHDDSDFGGTISNAFVIQSSNVTIRNLTVDGNVDGGLAGDENFRSAVISDSGLGSFSGISLNQLSIRNTFRTGVNFGAGASGSVNANSFAGNATDLYLGSLSGGITSLSSNSFSGHDWYIQNHSPQAINATGNTFDASSNFRIEDKIFHKMDDGALGLVSWVGGNLYVTDGGTDHSIQRAIEAAAAGDVVNIEAGTFLENVTVSKSLTLSGANAGIGGASASRGIESSIAPGSGAAITIADPASTVTLSGFDLHSSSDGVSLAAGSAIPKFITLIDSRFTAASRAIYLSGAASAIISGNAISASGNGINIAGGDDVTISQNDISGGSGSAIGIDSAGAMPATQVHILNNNLNGNDRGISIAADSYSGVLDVHTNSIAGNVTAGIDNQSSASVDATGNWWGSSNGPDSAVNLWRGTPRGDKILGANVTLAPWLTDGIDSSGDSGFQHAGPDIVAPVVSAPDLAAASDSGASDHDDITNHNSPTLAGTAEPLASIDLMEGSVVLGSSVADELGNWTISSAALADGVHNLFARAVDNSGNSASSLTLAVSIDTQAPAADAGADQVGDEGGLFTLSGNYTDTGGAGPYAFAWSQTAGAPVILDVSGNVATFTASDNGILIFNLTVTDAAGNSGSESVMITAANVAPALDNVAVTASIDEDGSVTVSGNIADLGADSFTLTVNWGEGLPQDFVLPVGSTHFSLTHQYRDDNPTGTASDVYSVGLTLSDDDGGSDSKTLGTTVNNVASIITSLTATPTISEGDAVTLGGSFTDPGTQDTYSLVVNWGEGEGSETFSLLAGVRTFSLTHLYRDDNPTGTASDLYTISVQLTDDDGGSAPAAFATTTINNAIPLLASVELDHTTIDENGEVIVTGSFTDASLVDIHTVNIDWGDGNFGLASVDQSTRTFTATHRYLDDNPSGTSSDPYNITVTATDDDLGVSAAVTRTITINNLAPSAAITDAPASSPEGTVISLSSTVLDTGTLDTFSYAWAVTKNGAPYASAATVNFSFTPNNDATYIVTLTVTDDDGGVGFDSKTITVTDVNPTIALSGIAHVNESSSYTLNLDAVSDPGADTVVRYYLNWGDSSPLEIFTSSGAKTHTYADGPATRTIVVSLEDENGIHPSAGLFTVTVDNVAPTATFGNLGSADEGSGGFVIFSGPSDASAADESAGFRYSYDFNNDGVFEIGNGTYAFGTTSNSATVPAAFLADGPGTRTIRGRISDRDGGFTDYLTTITINNVAPIVNAGPDAQSGVGAFFTQSANFIDPGADGPWTVWVNYNYDPISNAGLGIISQSGASRNFVLSHFYSTAGTYDVRVTVVDKDGGSNFDDVIVTVANTRFQVLSLTPTVSGFDVRFNRAVDTSKLNLYDGLDASIDPSDVSLFGAATGVVRGSAIWDFQGNILHFVKTGGPLAADNYNLTLQSRSDGFTDTSGELLDGNLDGVAGGDYTNGFTVAATTDRLLGVPDFARGPGQSVNIPASGAGIPIRIDNAAGVNAVDFDVFYDGFQLNITGASLAPGMPGDWTITTNLLTSGIFKITISGVSTLAAGARDLIILSASVPSSTPYGGSGIIRLANLSVNGGFIGSRADMAVHKTTFLGDASGNGSLDGFDSSLISRVVVALDSGFDHAQMTDPLIVADVNSNSVVDGLDASWVAQKSLFAPARPEIPDLPPGPIGSFAGFDPTFAMSEHVHATAGSSVIVPLSVTDSADGLFGFNINADYNTALLDVAGDFGSADVTLGSLFSSAGGWAMLSYVDDSLGSIRLSFYRTTAMAGGAGAIADVKFHVPVSAPSITAGLDVNGAAGSENGLLYSYSDGSIDIVTANATLMGTDGDDSYYIRRTLGNVLEVYSGTSAAGSLIYSAALADTNSISLSTGAGNDQLTIDLVNGSPFPTGGINFAAGADNDSLTIVGIGSGTGAYRPNATSGSGSFFIAGNTIAFSSVEPITASGFATLLIVTPSATDDMTIDKPVPGQNRVSGTSDGVAFSPITFFDVANPIINTAANDAGGGSDSITITNGLAASVAALGVDAGTGANTLTINGGTVPLLAIGGANLAVTAHNSALVSLVNSQTLQSLGVTDTSRINFASGQKIVHVNNLALDPGALVDVNDGRLEVENGGIFSTIRSYIRDGRNNGSSGIWSGNGITSSIVAADSGNLSLAAVLSGSTIVIQPALIGDLNLDGQVSISDFIDLAANFNASGIWANGDLNYDDVTTISDFIDLASHFNQIYSPPTSAPAFAAASEVFVAAPAAAESIVASLASTTATGETSSSPAKGHKKKTHGGRVVRHHRPGPARPRISRHQ
jgi:parallel beta-helix repeat protein